MRVWTMEILTIINITHFKCNIDEFHKLVFIWFLINFERKIEYLSNTPTAEYAWYYEDILTSYEWLLNWDFDLSPSIL